LAVGIDIPKETSKLNKSGQWKVNMISKNDEWKMTQGKKNQVFEKDIF